MRILPRNSYSASAYDGSLPTLDDQISLALLSLVRLVGRAARPTLPVRRTLGEAPNLAPRARTVRLAWAFCEDRNV